MKKIQISKTLQFSKFQIPWLRTLGFRIWDLFRISDFGFRIFKSCIVILIFAFCILIFTAACYAKEITILYTGETHSMLYTCSCPKEPDGGVARRAALIKQLKKNNPDTLLLDSGGFFAGGLMDEYTQNTELDKKRTLVNLKAMELMKYDALTIGDDEFNFGWDFLREHTSKPILNFLSCNIVSKKNESPQNDIGREGWFEPYLIKEVSGTKIGIIGVTTLLANQKAQDLKFIEPKIAVKQAVEELKKKDINIIILLSHLGESEDLSLIKDIAGIDILLIGHNRSKEEVSTKVGSTLVLRPSWQGRKLGKLSLTVEDNRIAQFKTEEIRLSDKISDDPEILSILPRCFSDTNCKKEGMLGVCQDAGSLNSRCLFTEAVKIPLLIITPRICLTCETEKLTDFLKKQFPGLVVSYAYYPDAKANELIREFGIKGLPVYLLGKEIEREKGFERLRDNIEKKGDFYMLKSQFSGISYFLKREKNKDKLDLFISLYDKTTPELLDTIKEFSPSIHFLAIEQNGGFDASKGNFEIEEYLRAVCVQNYYPKIFWDYISCRAKTINSSWWDDCLGGLEANKIKICSRGEEAKTLLKENISLNKELEIMFGPTYLLDNQEIFSSQGVPTKEELRKIIKR